MTITNGAVSLTLPTLPPPASEGGLRCCSCDHQICTAIKGTSVEGILQTTAYYHGVKVSDITGRSRKLKDVNARTCAAKRFRTDLKMKLQSIGDFLGHRDHSTVINLLKRRLAPLTHQPSTVVDDDSMGRIRLVS